MKTFSPVHTREADRQEIARHLAEYEAINGPISTSPILSDRQAIKFNAHRAFENPNKVPIDDIVKDYLAGYTAYELADKYRRSRSRIQDWLRERGVMRSSKQSREMARARRAGV